MTRRSRARARLSGPLLLAAIWTSGGCGGRLEAGVQVIAAEELGVTAGSPLVQGRDGGHSLRAWGRSIWLFGDTALTVPNEDGAHWRHNTFAYTPAATAIGALGRFEERLDLAGAPAPLLPSTPEEHAFNLAHAINKEDCAEPCGARWATWPAAGVHDPERDRVLIFYSLLYAEPGDFNFHHRGWSVAVWDAFEHSPGRPQLSPGALHPTNLFHQDDPGFGTAALRVDSEVFALGCEPGWLVHRCKLGKAPLAAVEERGAWRFWDGARWSAELREATTVFDAASIVHLEHNPHLGRFVALYSAPLSKRVVMRTAQALTGPWSDEVQLFEALAPEEAQVYDAIGHAEYTEEGGRILHVSYTRPTGEGMFGREVVLVRVEIAAR